MTGPYRVMTVAPTWFPPSNVHLPPWTILWSFGQTGDGQIVVEYKNVQGALLQSGLVPIPVPSPEPEQTAALDPCVASLVDNKGGVTERYRNDDLLFSWYQCVHGAWYLEDIRGGIGLYSRWIFVGPLVGPFGNPLDEARFITVWQKYHNLPDDALNYLGIALPPYG